MSRKARKKHSEAIYHIMSRSISEILLFKDNKDKEYYINLLKKYTELFQCSVYAYCLMDNHVHLHLDPKGFDISKIMHSLNTAYVCYYNKRHDRHGHLFQGRFESKILDTDAYNLAVSAYIHKNAKDIEGYYDKEETYEFSSYGIYLGIAEDSHGLVDTSFIRHLFNIQDYQTFTKRYCEFVSGQKGIQGLEQLREKLSMTFDSSANEYDSGRNIILRDKSPFSVMSYISTKLLNIARGSINISDTEETKDVSYKLHTGYSDHNEQNVCDFNDKYIDDINKTSRINNISNTDNITGSKNIPEMEVFNFPEGINDCKEIKDTKQLVAGMYAKCTQKIIYTYRVISAYALRVLCGLSYKEICSYLYNITISGCSRFCSKGYELILKDKVYINLWSELVSI